MSTPSLGTPANYGRNTFVMTERAAHEAWAALADESPKASSLMHRLVAMMGHQNAVVISQKTLAKLMKCSVDTVQRALKVLERGNWIQAVRLNSPGTVSAYVVNSNVAWGENRDQICRLSVFHAMVVADAADQTEETLTRKELRKLPIIYPPETAIPHGEGDPGAQMMLPGLEPVIEGMPRPIPE
ncbi:MAG: helix-turn-helix domain-containing protein [Rhodospirillaceae bacterium]